MVAHLHSVYDTDKHFTIDPVTRLITNQSEKLKLMQYDHKSERYTFEIPRYIEGHDMLESDRIEIHYDNISKSKKDVNSDVYVVKDIQVSPDDDTVAVFSWLLEIGSTMFAGKLNFRITFKCLSEDGTIDYEWNTETFKSITISEGINNTEKIPELHPDALEQIRLSLSKQIEESPNTYIVTVVLGEFSVLSSDKTYAEVLEAITTGKNVIVKYVATYMTEWLRLARIKNEILTFATEAYDTNFLYRTITFQLVGDETQVYQSWDYLIDNKLEESGRAADAKVVGDKFSAIVKNGTVVSENTDFAEVGEWSDGNQDAEDRTGYFVSVDTSESGKTMVKATSISDVRGVTITQPAFAANASSDKYDSDGNLLPQYNYVCFAGFAPVKDNGTCEVNGRCISSDDGTAVPSSNNMGYQVIERIDDTHVLLLIEPQADMMVRIKGDISYLQDKAILLDTTANVGDVAVVNSVDENGKATEWKTEKKIGKSGTGVNSERFNSGNTASGMYSHAEGSNTRAVGDFSHAEGYSTTSSGSYSHAEGSSTTSSGSYSHAEGSSTTASGTCSHVEGSNVSESGSTMSNRTIPTDSNISSSFTIKGSEARGKNSHAEGTQTLAYGYSSHSEGQNAIASGLDSHAEGYGTTASGKSSHAEGGNFNVSGDSLSDLSYTSTDFSGISGTITVKGPTAYGIQSHAEGTQTIAYGYSSHAEGSCTKAFGQNSHTEGQGTNATGTYSHAEGAGTTASNFGSHAEGAGTTASGQYSHAEGMQTKASGQFSHAEGHSTTSSGNWSHAEGQGTNATGTYSHAEGVSTTASNFASHAEGAGTTASGQYSHAEGGGTTASGNYSHAEGLHTTASGNYSHAEGSNHDSSGKELSNLSYTSTDFSDISRTITVKGPTAYGIQSHAEGTQTLAYGYSSHAEGFQTKSFGDYSHAEGYRSTASGVNSHAEGSGTAYGIFSHAESGGNASGERSHAGDYGIASGAGSFCHGNSGSSASGINSTVFGCYGVQAKGDRSFATGGYGINAEGESSFANGKGNVYAKGIASHAEGTGTIAGSDYQYAHGKFNIEDANSKYAHIVGNGSSADFRSNAHTLDWSGNAWFAGDVFVGGTGQDDKAVKKLVTADDVTEMINTALGVIENGSY